MNVFGHLRLVRAILTVGVALRALVWGVVAALTLIVGAALADLATPLPLAIRSGLIVVAVLAAPAIAIAFAWRDRAVLSLDRVALWVEEHFPSLEYALVTAVETGNDALVSTAAPVSWAATARRRAARVLGAPLAAIVVAVAVILLLPAGAVARVRSPHAGDALDRAGAAARADASHLVPLVGQVVPPAYSGERPQTIDEPSDVRALVGSVLTVRGRGDGRGIVARVGDSSLAATMRGDRWEIAIRVESKPVAIRLIDRAFSRVIALEPVPDLPPAVTLASPAHDSVLRKPSGRIPLAAEVSDDYGITSASFEYIISSGEGETFTFRSGQLGAVRPNDRRASFTSSLSIDSLALKPGDIVHLRAVARDANDVTGPGVGVSETRSIRIARADEYDSVAVEAAAPSEADKSVISERMLILLAEALEKKRPSLKRDVLVGESHAIAVDQRKLRRTVGEIVFTRLGGDPTGEEHTDDDQTRAKTMGELLARADSATNRSVDPIDFEGGESPVVAVNKPLLEAYNAMWDATTSLELGEPARALPHMRRALAAIQKARQAERIYLRGAPPPVVIDVDKARLKGKDKGISSTRRGLSQLDSASRARADRFARIIELAAREPQAVVDSLLVLRIDALADNPAFAAALSDAVTAMRRGKSDDAASSLARARRALGGTAVSRDSLSRWGLVP
ncbi:MAG: hypothetical protein JWM41_1063 [Gemmatimonadetes bacterium]|nr:hypothetical protein [Gemmatimonadota bacterium]